MGAHRNVFEDNRILDNGAASGDTKASVIILGCHDQLVFRRNTIGSSKALPARVGILTNKQATALQAEDNEFLHVEKKVALSR